LEDAQIKQKCATLLWLCVNDCAAKLNQIAGKPSRQRAKVEVAAAIRGVEAAAYVYTHLDSKPHLAEYLGTLKADLLEKQRMLTAAPPPLNYGRHLAWDIVEDAQQTLSQLLGVEVSDAVMAELLSAAFDVCGWERREISEDGVRHGLERFRERRLSHRFLIIARDKARRFPPSDK
jgi:hypothetical protein